MCGFSFLLRKKTCNVELGKGRTCCNRKQVLWMILPVYHYLYSGILRLEFQMWAWHCIFVVCKYNTKVHEWKKVILSFREEKEGNLSKMDKPVCLTPPMILLCVYSKYIHICTHSPFFTTHILWNVNYLTLKSTCFRRPHRFQILRFGKSWEEYKSTWLKKERKVKAKIVMWLHILFIL